MKRLEKSLELWILDLVERRDARIKTPPQVDAYLNKRREREARLAASLNMEPNRCCFLLKSSMSGRAQYAAAAKKITQ